jgi:hypothetical protein
MSRPNKLQSQLEAALHDAETATGADISAQKLIQTRLTILNKMAGRQQSAKLRKLKEEVTRLRIENEHLKMELARLAQGQASSHPTAVEINEVLRKYGVRSTEHGGKDAV